MGSPTVTPKTEALNISDVVKALLDHSYCLEIVTLDTGIYVCGNVLANGDFGNKKVVSVPAEADSVCLENVTSVLHAGVAVVLVRGPAIVDGDLLDYNEEEKALVDVALLSHNILVKDNVTA